MNENPLNPQITDIKAKGMIGMQLSRLYSVLMALGWFFGVVFFAGLAPSVKITLYGHLRHLQYIKLSCSVKQAAKLRPY